ncbi:hypothetical protein RclHR1_12310003 [Rhizophagus clarus]|uniref:Uncharacterized protein n=1 Tax=Rhizophagus clarus TaxID=94130 RepID=A0A2Z6Q6U6_9GLOM|nr:hypothetical protein RclHR1_12310003 [Rhizophagus clarus]GES73287.1 hypothetical protein GLOIN_2v1830066 [Rhizophagus clarus]
MTTDDDITFNCIFLPTIQYQCDIAELAKQSKRENLPNLKEVADLSRHPACGYYIAEPYDVIVLKANKKDAVDVLRHQITKRLKPLFNISSSTLRLFMLKNDTSICEAINTYNSVMKLNEARSNPNTAENSNETDPMTNETYIANIIANRANLRNRVNRINLPNEVKPLKSKEMRPYEKIDNYFDKNGRYDDIQIIASDDKHDPYNTGKNFLEVLEY